MYVQVRSGLTSRCITLAHSYHLLKILGSGHKKLVIVWPLEDVCRIHFWEVFDHDIFNDIELKIIELKYPKYPECFKWGGVLSNIKKGNFIKAIQIAAIKAMRMFLKLVKNLYWGLIAIIFGKNYYDFDPPKEVGWSVDKYKYREQLQNTWNQVQTALSGNRETYIHAYCGIIQDEEQEKVDYSVIKFRKEYWEKVEKIMLPEEKYIGIHIRRTDHDRAIKESGTEAFIQKIDEIIKKKEDAKFFLATDDISEEERMKKLYGDKLIVQENKKWGRNSSSEMKSGIIDCLCLSCCEYILGSYASVFSNFSARYGGKELIICRNEDT